MRNTSVIIAGVVGYERDSKNRPAGVKTYMLVALGSTSVMLTNLYATSLYTSGDPVRLAAQVVSGIGFLGAGTILTTRHNQITGLTTAAGLWAVACLGLVIGIGLYEVALVAVVILFLIFTFFKKDKIHDESRTKYLDVLVAFEDNSGVINFLKFAQKQDWTVKDAYDDKTYGEGNVFYHFSLTFTDFEDSKKILDTIRNLNGVIYAEALDY